MTDIMSAAYTKLALLLLIMGICLMAWPFLIGAKKTTHKAAVLLFIRTTELAFNMSLISWAV